MSEKLKIYGFDTSNNFKVRVGLGYKEIPFDFERIDPGERGRIVELSGQELTPVMLHGDTVLFDSAAILRYLDANWRQAPRLFGRGKSEQWEIEEWERYGRGELSEGMMMLVHRRVTGGRVDEELQATAARRFEEAAGRLMQRLAEADWLVGASMTAADVTCAPVVFRISQSGILTLPQNMGNIPDWVDRVMAYDPVES